MNTLALLTDAIQRRKPITFEYVATGRAVGLRYGNPHAVFIDTNENINAHIWKTGGVSTEPTTYPDWRKYIVKQIVNVRVLEQQSFELAPGYNPHSKIYERVIVKI